MSTPEATGLQSEELEVIPSPKAKKGKVVKEEDSNFGLVLYSDGSAQPTNPGFGGWGIHGYIYSHLPPTKGSGNSSQFLTAEGYQERATYAKHGKAKPAEVKPLSYVNGFGSFASPITNNVAEVAATSNALAYAVEKGVRKVLIKTDSKYAMNGTTDWLKSWKKNNWYKGDGTPVANKEMWLQLDEHLQALKDRGTDVEMKWVKGHSTHLGNQIADKNADIGAFYSMRGDVRTEFDTRQADGYWSTRSERHPFICQRRLYFTSVPETNVPGEYYLGEHGMDDDEFAKRSADRCYSYIKMAEPEALIEMLRKKQILEANGQDSIIVARLDKLFEAKTSADLEQYGDIIIRRSKDRARFLDLDFVDGEPLTKEMKPPKLSMRGIVLLNTLKGVFDAWLAADYSNMASTDVTDLFYEKTDKGEYRLKSEFIVGFNSLPIEVSYGKAVETQKAKINLCLGVDLPDRNALKKLEKHKPQVIVVTWMEADKAFRYATIVKAGDNYGIWAGMYSNLRVLS